MPAAEALALGGPSRHPLVERVLSPGAIEPLRLGAARGALPIPAQDLVYLQVKLLADASAAVAEAARDSLGRMTPESLLATLRDPACDPEVVDHLARSGLLKGDSLAAAVAHPSITNATLEVLADKAPTEALTLIVTNEIRIIAHPSLLTRLRSNPNLTGDLRRRLAELEQDFIGREPLRRPTAVAAETAAAQPAVGPGPPAGELNLPEGALPDALPEDADDGAPPPEPMDEQLYEEELRKTDAFQRIMRLNVAERNLLAMKGSAEERAILIRDTARLVSHAVLKNPRISESEITVYAGMRSLHEDILRSIASHRDWTKTYAVALALVRNPKTPPGLSVQFLARLGTRDLKIAVSDKNIPELVRRQARNLFIARTQPAKKKFKKAH